MTAGVLQNGFDVALTQQAGEVRLEPGVPFTLGLIHAKCDRLAIHVVCSCVRRIKALTIVVHEPCLRESGGFLRNGHFRTGLQVCAQAARTLAHTAHSGRGDDFPPVFRRIAARIHGNGLALRARVNTDALPPAIDASVLELLRSLAVEGEPDPVAEIATTFITDANNRIDRMNDALLAGDMASARKAAHSLRGMSGAIGAMHLSLLSREVEVAEPGAIDRARIQLLRDEFQRVSAALLQAA